MPNDHTPILRIAVRARESGGAVDKVVGAKPIKSGSYLGFMVQAASSSHAKATALPCQECFNAVPYCECE